MRKPMRSSQIAGNRPLYRKVVLPLSYAYCLFFKCILLVLLYCCYSSRCLELVRWKDSKGKESVIIWEIYRMGDPTIRARKLPARTQRWTRAQRPFTLNGEMEPPESEKIGKGRPQPVARCPDSTCRITRARTRDNVARLTQRDKSNQKAT